eukprot:307958-Amphidinium_carterae.1
MEGLESQDGGSQAYVPGPVRQQGRKGSLGLQGYVPGPWIQNNRSWELEPQAYVPGLRPNNSDSMSVRCPMLWWLATGPL